MKPYLIDASPQRRPGRRNPTRILLLSRNRIVFVDLVRPRHYKDLTPLRVKRWFQTDRYLVDTDTRALLGKIYDKPGKILNRKGT